jgi:uncharacterized protein (DUF302 family)
MEPDTPFGIAELSSNYSVEQTTDRLKSTLQSKGIGLFAVIDHSGEAEQVGIAMPPTKLLIFGSPKAGTPLMLAAPSCAIDLPLKLLIREDSRGRVLIYYNSREYFQLRHRLPLELVKSIAVVEALAAEVAG